MKSLLDQLRPIVSQIDAKRPFTFLALLLREGATSWDLIVSAPWLPLDNPRSQRTISDLVRGALDEDGLLELGRIVLIDPKEKGFAADVASLPIEAEEPDVMPQELRHFTFSGLPIERGYVFVASSLAANRANGRKLAKAL